MKKNRFRVAIVVLIILIVFLIALVCRVVQNRKNSSNIPGGIEATETVIGAEGAEKKHASLTEQNARAGEIGKITQTAVVNQKTGTAPFDANDNAGNDSSESNNVVRSFDQIIWTLELTMDLKDASTGESGLGGIIQLEADLPASCKNCIMWDLDSMAWAEDATITEEGTKFTANYSLDSSSITVPGKKTLVVVVQALNAPNGLQFKPTFKTKLYGNTDSEISTATTNSNIRVSAAPKYNILLTRNGSFTKKTKSDFDLGVGRMYGYSFVLQIHNGESELDRSKGLKGIEFPKGEITFDIDLKLTRGDLGSSETEDITSQCTPILWNYSYNYGTTGILADKTMNFGSYSQYNVSVPWGVRTGDRHNSTYNSGNITINQTGSKLRVSVKDYEIDGVFPHYHAHYAGVDRSSPIYGEQIGVFSIGYMQIFVPDNSASTMENKNYYITLSDNNFRATSVSNAVVTSQIITTDDNHTSSHVIYSPGSYSQELRFDSPSVTSIYWAGDGRATMGQNLMLYSYFMISPASDDDVLSATKFIKFDGNAIEPRLYNTETGDKFYRSWGGDDPMNFNVWYVTKQDGTNWTSTDEQRDAQIENMRLYANIEDIPAGYKCVGEYFESTTGKLEPGYHCIYIPIRVKLTAEIGKTYGFMQRTKMWITEVNRNQYSITRNSPTTWPEARYDSGDLNYIKTEYDENGTMIAGTHSGGQVWGQSLLVIGSSLTVSKKPIDPETGATKVNYDLGKGENIVTFKIEPVLPANASFVMIDDVRIKVEDTLPEGIEYIPGSCNYVEPEITNNPDGTTTLVWYKDNCATGRKIDEIIYRANIPVETDNGVQFETSVLVSEVIQSGEQTRTGITAPEFRTAKTAITIINMETYGLFKNTNTPVIERNENIKYNLIVTNTSEVDAPQFQLLDIMPYNGDALGTSYHGGYAVEKIVMKQIKTENDVSEEVPLTITAYVSTNQEVRSLNAKNAFNDETLWEQVSSGQYIDVFLTGIAFRGNLAKRNKVEIEIYIRTNNNQPKDVYKNAANLQTRASTAAVSSQIAVTRVISRALTGTVWNDRNEDGIMDNTEEKIQGATVTLLNSDGSTARDIYGQNISSTTTDENGFYRFENMVRGNYKIRVAINYMQQITQKEAGGDERVNSKFNPNKETDTLTRLNGINQAIIEQDYINAGVVYQNSAGVIVHHYEVDSTRRIKLANGNEAQDILYIGKVTDPYSTTDERGRAEYYRLLEDRLPSNATGRMKLEQTVVTYYYMPQAWIEVVKKDNETGAVLPNTKFGVYSNSSCTQLVQELTTGTDGTAKTRLLDKGTYYVKELQSSSENYKINDEIKVVNIVNAGETYQVVYTDIPRGYIEITKKDDFTGEVLANAQFKIFANSNLTGLVTTLTTGPDGKAKTELIEAGTYYIQEVQPPEHYNLNESISTVRVWEAGATVPLERRNIPHRGYIETVKKDNQTGEIITKESATFALYEWSVAQNTWVKPTHIIESEYDGLVSDGIGYKLKEKVAGTKGTYKTGTLYYNAQNDGKFKVVEYDSPLGYTLENQEKVITITRDGQTESQDFRDEEIKGTINFIKLDKEINYNNSNYPLGTAQADATIEGAVYGLYAKENILSPDTGAIIYAAGELIEQKTTDSEGKITWSDLYLGRYYVKEITASDGYLLDTEEHEVNLLQYYIDNVRNTNDRTTTNVVYENRESYSLYLNPEKRVISAEQVKKQAIKILKITSYIDLSDEDLRVQGATFKAYLVSKLDVDSNCNYKDIMNKYYNAEIHEYQLPEEAEAMTFRVNHDGEFLGELVTDENGEVTSEKLAYGRYVLIEVDGAADTQVAGEVVTDLELARPFFVRILEYSDTPQQDRIITDPHMTAFIEVNKKDTTTRKNVRKAGSEYLINKITTSNEEIDGEVLTREPVTQIVSYPSRIEVGTLENPFKTDEEGKFTTSVALNVGLYELVEIKSPEGYVINGYEAHTENGEIISDAKDTIKFKIATTEVYEENPYLETDGYNGGNKNGNIITVEQYNTPQTGTITITKFGEYQDSAVEEEVEGRDENKYLVSYSQKPVEGAEFTVYAKEDIYTNDNQINAETGERTKYYSQGQEVTRITTGADGKAYADNLPLGKYIIRETVAGDGYILNTEEKEFEISTNTLDAEEIVEGEIQKTAVNKEEGEFINERQKAVIKIFKTDVDNTEKRIANAEFSIYAKEDIINRDGEVIVEKYSLVGIAETGENGVATFEEDLPLGLYYVKETKSPYGYKTNDRIIEIDATYAGQEARIAEVTEEMQDERKDTRVIVHHYIEDTTIRLSDDEEINGKVFDEYRTEPATDIPEYYMVKEIPENSEGQMKEEEIVVTYYYKLRPYTVIINYLREDDDDDDTNNEVIHELKEIPNQTYETEIVAADEIIDIPGYEYVRTDKEILSVGTVEEENYINIYYRGVKYKYTVEYYYNGEIDEDKTEEMEADYKTFVEEYPDKVEDGYRFEKDENVPLEITANEEENVIKVYYIPDDEQTREVRYRVEYYKEGVHIHEDTQAYVESVQVLEPDTVNVKKDEINTEDKYEGFVLEKITVNDEIVDELPDEVNDTDVIKVYYVRKDTTIIVKYVDKEGNEIKEEYVEEGKYEDIFDIDEVDDKVEGYRLFEKSEEGKTHFELEPKTIIFVYEKEARVKIKYVNKITGEEIEEEEKEGVVDEDYTTEPKDIEGYKLVREEIPANKDGKMTEEDIQVNYYYVKETKIKVQYLELDTGEELANEIVERGYEGDPYTTEKKSIAGYEYVKVEGEVAGAMGNTEKVIRYYYTKERPKSEPIEETPTTRTYYIENTPETTNSVSTSTTITRTTQNTINSNTITVRNNSNTNTTNTTNTTNNTIKTTINGPATGDRTPDAMINIIAWVVVANIVQISISKLHEDDE